MHCAADGLKYPPLIPVWRPEGITLQAIRAGFPCFGAALVGYVEATRGDDYDKNRLCPPTGYGNSMAEWARMNVPRHARGDVLHEQSPTSRSGRTECRSTRRGSRPNTQAR